MKIEIDVTPDEMIELLRKLKDAFVPVLKTVHSYPEIEWRPDGSFEMRAGTD